MISYVKYVTNTKNVFTILKSIKKSVISSSRNDEFDKSDIKSNQVDVSYGGPQVPKFYFNVN